MATFWGNVGGVQGNMNVPQAAPNNSMITFINDDSIVAAYPVAPGCTVALINVTDPANSKMYIKYTEANGMQNPTRVFELKEITPRAQGNDFASRQEIDNLNQQVANLSSQLQQVLAAFNNKGEDGAK